jgi:hypothetical protein
MQQKKVCANCGIVIFWQPTLVDARIYCCPGCAQGGPCECDYDNLPKPGDVNAMVLQTSQKLGDGSHPESRQSRQGLA